MLSNAKRMFLLDFTVRFRSTAYVVPPEAPPSSCVIYSWGTSHMSEVRSGRWLVALLVERPRGFVTRFVDMDISRVTGLTVLTLDTLLFWVAADDRCVGLTG